MGPEWYESDVVVGRVDRWMKIMLPNMSITTTMMIRNWKMSEKIWSKHVMYVANVMESMRI